MAQYSILPVRNTKIRVGLLGGSFNPAHEGHLYISIEALKRLKLDLVIWLVSPQNPLKTVDIKNTLDDRIEYAEKVAQKHDKILVSGIERHFPNTYTANTIIRLQKMHPNTCFMWIMGGDNAIQLHRWYKWKNILNTIRIVVFDRFNLAFKVMRSKALVYYNNINIVTSYTKASKKDWCFFRIKQVHISSTEIRERNEQES